MTPVIELGARVLELLSRLKLRPREERAKSHAAKAKVLANKAARLWEDAREMEARALTGVVKKDRHAQRFYLRRARVLERKAERVMSRAEYHAARAKRLDP